MIMLDRRGPNVAAGNRSIARARSGVPLAQAETPRSQDHPTRVRLCCGGGTVGGMNGILIGDTRVSTADQDLTSQRAALLRLGVLDSNIYIDHGLTGTNRAKPGLREALAAVREGDTLVVTKLDRLARSVKDAREIADELTTKKGWRWRVRRVT
ncbi:recombinase family protein [Microbacterium sp. E-13]|uniref:recombinase family protein n=1 Tax=Microbacterium sp. E-13 TaxID=3404048 RepID=UPI003CF86908